MKECPYRYVQGGKLQRMGTGRRRSERESLMKRVADKKLPGNWGALEPDETYQVKS